MNLKNQNLPEVPIWTQYGQILMADVIHKMKNSLGGISGYTTLLEKELKEDDPNRRMLERIHKNVIQLDGYIVDLMTLCKKIEPDYEMVNMNYIFKEIWNAYRAEEQSNLKNTKLELPKQMVKINTDQEMLNQTIFHTIRFLDKVSANIDKIKVDLSKTQEIIIDCLFQSMENHKEIPNPIDYIFNTAIPLKGRLSIAIVLKILGWNQGKLSIDPLKNKRKRLMVYYKSRNNI